MHALPHVAIRIVLGALIFCMLVPIITHAQTSSADLRETIRLSLLQDPRTAELSSAELNAMVDILTLRASQEGITSEDILWRPAEAPAAVEYCPEKSFFCNMSLAFGFVGNDARIPAALAILSAILILILAAYREHHMRELGVQPAY